MDSRDATCGTATWTTEKPKVDGWYWLEEDDWADAVWVTTHKHDQVTHVYYVGLEGSIKLDDIDESAKWHGPILPPED